MIDWLRRAPQELAVRIGERDVPVAIRRHPRARRLVMRLAPDGSEVRVTLPRWGRTEDALVFARARREWLELQLAALPQASAPEPGGTLNYRGADLVIGWDARHPRRPGLEGEILRIGGTAESLAPRLQRWLESEAQRLMDEDLAFYCARAGHDTPPLKLSRAQRRWGSCSDRRMVRINWRLVQAPDFVRRSVVAHEVAHLTHFDHSPAFHALLARLYDDDLPAADSWLRQHGRSLYAVFG